MSALPIYPAAPADRDRWILDHRPPRNQVDPHLPYAFLVEPELSSSTRLVDVATLFLTNRECPWRCLMCDLWQNTLTGSVPPGAIAAQVRHALARLPPAPHIKLYNSGSFFDPHAIPPDDYPEIAALLQPFTRVIVESHPALVGTRTLHLQDLLPNSQLEVAMGLETIHPLALERSNKRLTLEAFAAASEFLGRHRIDLRVFLLVQPPFVPPAETLLWTTRSIDFALGCGATAITLIPTRAGNGALEDLALTGDFTPPSLSTLEAALDDGLARARHHVPDASPNDGPARTRIFLDLWDIGRTPAACPACAPARIDRLRRINLTQQSPPHVACPFCEPAV